MADWESLRALEFPVASRWAYFDHAAVAPLPRRSVERLAAWSTDAMSNGVAHWGEWAERLEIVRDRIAALISARTDEIALVPSTTVGIGLVAEGLEWKAGDNVVTAFEEYPSNVYPWMNLASRGVSLRRVPGRDGAIWPEDLAGAMDDRTRVLAISHVEFASGFRNDLDALCSLCRERGVAVLVDAIQSLGAIAIDVRKTPVDFLATGGQKWLLGPEGSGFLYVRSEWIDKLRTLGVGSRSVVGHMDYSNIDFTLRPGAKRWEGGAYNMGAIQTLGASLEILHEVGIERASARILDRAARVRAIAEEAGWSVYGSRAQGDLSGIVSIERPGVDARACVKPLRESGVIASWRGGRLRLSPHIYTNEADLARLGEALAGLKPPG